MIQNTHNHLLNQMQALESLAKNRDIEPGADSANQPSFAELMQKAVDQVNETQSQASQLRTAFEMGEAVDLTQVMIAAQKSRISFEALNQVRNKLLSAYQDVMNMSV